MRDTPIPAAVRGTWISKTGRGTFFCPQCQSETVYRQVTVRRAVRVAGIDLVPLRRAAEYIECQRCRGTFIPEVLLPEAQSWNLKPLQLQAALRVMLLMMLADGVIADSEVRTVAEVYQSLGGEFLPSSAVLTQAEHARADRRDIDEYLETTALTLNEEGKLTVIRGAYEVAAADGEFQAEERQLMRRIVTLLRPSADPFQTLGIQMPLA